MQYLRRLINYVAPGVLDHDSAVGTAPGGSAATVELRAQLEPLNERLQELRQRLADQTAQIDAAHASRGRDGIKNTELERTLLAVHTAREQTLEEIARVTTERELAISMASQIAGVPAAPPDPTSAQPDALMCALARARGVEALRSGDNMTLGSHALLELCLSQLEFWFTHRRRLRDLVWNRFQAGELMQQRILNAIDAVDGALAARASVILDHCELGARQGSDRELNGLLEENEESFRLVIELTAQLVEQANWPSDAVAREQGALRGLQSIAERLQRRSKC